MESGEMKTISPLFLLLLLASGACDDVKFITKRNSGRMNDVGVCCLHFAENEPFPSGNFPGFVLRSYSFLLLFSSFTSLQTLFSLLLTIQPLVFSHTTPSCSSLSFLMHWYVLTWCSGHVCHSALAPPLPYSDNTLPQTLCRSQETPFSAESV